MKVLSYLFFWVSTVISKSGSLTPLKNKDTAWLSEMASPGILLNFCNYVRKLLMYCAALHANIIGCLSNLYLKESSSLFFSAPPLYHSQKVLHATYPISSSSYCLIRLFTVPPTVDTANCEYTTHFICVFWEAYVTSVITRLYPDPPKAHFS